MHLEYNLVQKQRSSKRLEYVVRIGPGLMDVLKGQMKKIKDVTYGVVGDSLWEAGEIVAKKYKGEV